MVGIRVETSDVSTTVSAKTKTKNVRLKTKTESEAVRLKTKTCNEPQDKDSYRLARTCMSK